MEWHIIATNQIPVKKILNKPENTIFRPNALTVGIRRMIQNNLKKLLLKPEFYSNENDRCQSALICYWISNRPPDAVS